MFASNAARIRSWWGLEQGGQETPDDDHCRVEDVGQAGQPTAQPLADVGHRLLGPCIARSGRTHHFGHAVHPGDVRASGQAHERRLADERLQATAVAAMAFRPGRVDHDVPDLPGQPARAVQGHPAGNDTAADADPSGDEQDVIDAARRTAQVFRQRA